LDVAGFVFVIEYISVTTHRPTTFAADIDYRSYAEDNTP